MLLGRTDNTAYLGVCSGTARKKPGGKDGQRHPEDPENDAAFRGRAGIPYPGPL